MIRDLNDPRVAEVIRVFHRHAGSPNSCAMQFASEYVDAIMGEGYCRGDVFVDWPASSLLALLTAYLMHAPEGNLDVAVATARAQLAALIDAEKAEEAECAGKSYRSRFDYPKTLQAEWERYQDEKAVVA